MKNRLADAARTLGGWCVARAERLEKRHAVWIARGFWFADVATWLTSRDPWSAIRARRKGEG